MKRILSFSIALMGALAAHGQSWLSIINPTNGATVMAPLVLQVGVGALPVFENIVRVEYFANGQSIGIATNSFVPLPIKPVFPTNPIAIGPGFPITPIQILNPGRTNPVMVIPVSQTNPVIVNPVGVVDPEAGLSGAPREASLFHRRQPLVPIISPLPSSITIQPIPTPWPIPRPWPIPFPRWPYLGLYWNPAPGDYTLTAKATIRTTVISDPVNMTTMSDPVNVRVVPIPIVTVVATQPIASPGSPGDFTISRTGDTNTDLTVDFSLYGNALNGVDYATVSDAVTIPAGVSSVDISINGLQFSATNSKVVVLGLVGVQGAGIVPVGTVLLFHPSYELGTPSSAMVYIKARPRNEHAPSVAILLPYPGQRFPAGTNIGVYARAMDPDTDVTTVDFFDGAKQIGEQLNTLPIYPGEPRGYGFVWSNAPAGIHFLHARATDTQGAKQVSAPVRIEVAPKR